MSRTFTLFWNNVWFCGISGNCVYVDKKYEEEFKRDVRNARENTGGHGFLKCKSSVWQFLVVTKQDDAIAARKGNRTFIKTIRLEINLFCYVSLLYKIDIWTEIDKK